MKVLRNLLFASVGVLLASGAAWSQCDNWEDSENKTAIMEAHVLYRGMAKGKTADDLAKLDETNFNIVYDNWKKAYEMAPAADGKRTYHFVDGIEILKAVKKRTTDEAQKKELDEQILSLYDQLAECYPDKIGVALGRKAYDMFYMPAYGYRTTTLEAFQDALDRADTELEYLFMEPMGQLINFLFKKGQIDKLKAQEMLTKAQDIAEFNVENNERFAQYYEYSEARMLAAVKEVESDIFDCEYFEEKLLPVYRENPEDLETIRYVYNKLKAQGCSDEQEIMQELKGKYESMAAELNAQMEAEFLAKNPGVAARRIFDEARELEASGDKAGATAKYKEAIAKYEEAIEKGAENDVLAGYYFGIASIQFRELNELRTAREYARKAADLKSNWGRPYMLIGDMYASSSRSCGNDGYSRGLAILAAIDKYAYAKSIDEEVAQEASRKINLYNKSIPFQSDVFMRGKQDATERVGCWIGEMVKVRYQSDN